MENNNPHGWEFPLLGDVINITSGNSSLTKKVYKDDGKFIAFSGTGPDGKVDFYENEGEAIILSAVGARCGKCFRANGQWTTIANTSIIRAFANDTKHVDYLFYLLNNENFWPKGGSGQPFVQTGKAQKETPIPLPPLAEQHRIVAKLDAIMQKVENNKQRLEKIPKLLKRFRQSVLAAAVSGNLTVGWRKENKNIESATCLLERIKQERIKRYEVECQKAKKENKRKPTKRFLDVVPNVDYGFSTDIPESWAITNIDFLAWVTKLAGFEYTKYIKFSSVGEVPVIRAQNVQMGEFVDENIIYIDKKTSDFLERSQLFGREILMVFIGAGTGNVCLCPSDKRWHLAPNVAKIDVDGISNHYLNYYLQSPIGLRNTLSFMKATAQPSLSMETIRQVAVQLPPLEEQKEIVKQIEKLFAFADKLEARYTKAKTMLDRLPQSILAKAFRGELVAQDPNDEPASVLLERIKKEKEKIKSTINSKTKRINKSAAGKK
jgi:type I restriction enzyme S subunit